MSGTTRPNAHEIDEGRSFVVLAKSDWVSQKKPCAYRMESFAHKHQRAKGVPVGPFSDEKEDVVIEHGTEYTRRRESRGSLLVT